MSSKTNPAKKDTMYSVFAAPKYGKRLTFSNASQDQTAVNTRMNAMNPMNAFACDLRIPLVSSFATPPRPPRDMPHSLCF